MGTRFKNSEELNKKHAKILGDLLRIPENRFCSDCDSKEPRWASTNLGIFFCIRCSGIHRALGVHISKVKSVTLDTWSPDQVEFLCQMSNVRANAYWEANLPSNFPKPKENDDARIAESFIRNKYERKQWAARGAEPPRPGAIPSLPSAPSAPAPVQSEPVPSSRPVSSQPSYESRPSSSSSSASSAASRSSAPASAAQRAAAAAAAAGMPSSSSSSSRPVPSAKPAAPQQSSPSLADLLDFGDSTPAPSAPTPSSAPSPSVSAFSFISSTPTPSAARSSNNDFGDFISSGSTATPSKQAASSLTAPPAGGDDLLSMPSVDQKKNNILSLFDQAKIGPAAGGMGSMAAGPSNMMPMGMTMGHGHMGMGMNHGMGMMNMNGMNGMSGMPHMGMGMGAPMHQPAHPQQPGGGMMGMMQPQHGMGMSMMHQHQPPYGLASMGSSGHGSGGMMNMGGGMPMAGGGMHHPQYGMGMGMHGGMATPAGIPGAPAVSFYNPAAAIGRPGQPTLQPFGK